MFSNMSSILRPKVLRIGIKKSIFTVTKPTIADVVTKRTKETLEGATMNDLPVPFGSWAESNKKRQQKYNTILFAGIISMVISLVVLRTSDVAKYLRNSQYIENFNYDSEY